MLITKVPRENLLISYFKCKYLNPMFPENHCVRYDNKDYRIKQNNQVYLPVTIATIGLLKQESEIIIYKIS